MLRETVRALTRAFQEAGIVADKLNASSDVFTGNITFCRFTAQPRTELLEYAARLSDMSLGQFLASTLQLVSCDEVCSCESMRTHATVHAG
jgi:hypothetical protein